MPNIDVSTLLRLCFARRPILIVGADANQRHELATRILAIELDAPERTGVLRAPHSTISSRGLSGAPLAGQQSEFDMATGGVLLLEDISAFYQATLRALAKRIGEPNAPLLIFGSDELISATQGAFALFCPVETLTL